MSAWQWRQRKLDPAELVRYTLNADHETMSASYGNLPVREYDLMGVHHVRRADIDAPG